MGRKSLGARVIGVYRNRGGYTVATAGEDGRRNSRWFASEADAEDYRALVQAKLQQTPRTLEAALDEYEAHLQAKGNKPRSYRETMRRLRLWFDPDLGHALPRLSHQRCADRYAELAEKYSVDTHRNYLAEAKSFLRWCHRVRHWVKENPLDGVEGFGKRRHGKEQLHGDEARKFLALALKRARSEPGAVAAAMTLLLGMRAEEVVKVRVRDVDDGGRLLWIDDAKTPAGRRTLEVAEVLRPHLARLAKKRGGEELLLGRHNRHWTRKNVQRLCRLAKIPIITAHGMRGTHSSLAVETGATSQVVAAALGHESYTTTARSYTKKSAQARGKADRAEARLKLKVLKGGRG